MADAHLLLVDPDDGGRHLLAQGLTQAGFLVTSVADGHQAWQKLSQKAFDAILSESHMPYVNGFQLCQMIRRQDHLSQTPFLFLSHHANLEYKIQGLEIGANDYLIKPVYTKEVITRLKLLLHPPHRQQNFSQEHTTSLSGSLEDMSIADLMQTLQISGKSGKLLLKNPQADLAWMYFKEGTLLDAKYQDLLGMDAVYALLNWQEGSFQLERNDTPQRQTIHLSSQQILLEHLKKQDENNHHKPPARHPPFAHLNDSLTALNKPPKPQQSNTTPASPISLPQLLPPKNQQHPAPKNLTPTHRQLATLQLDQPLAQKKQLWPWQFLGLLLLCLLPVSLIFIWLLVF